MSTPPAPMTGSALNIGIVGAGVFGGYHTSKIKAHDRAKLIGIYDSSQKALKAAAAKHDAKGYSDYNKLLGRVDAVIIACPASAHADMALAALRAGKHVLVEKPIAADLKSAQDMVDIASLNNCIVQVGHQERFVARAIGLDTAPERPIAITARRMGPYSVRGTDVSVTQDLMTHDIDMALYLMGETPSDVDGESLAVISETPDAARAILRFPNGGVARLEASRVEDKQERIMTITYPSGLVRIDFINKSFDNDTGFDFDAGFASNPIAADSLGAGTDAFIAAILDAAPVPITGREGLEALRVAVKIDETP